MTLLSVQGGICWRQAWSRNSGTCYSKVWADRRVSCCIRGRGIPHRCLERHLDRNSTSSLPMSLDHPVRFERGTPKKKIYFTKVEGCKCKNVDQEIQSSFFCSKICTYIINQSATHGSHDVLISQKRPASKHATVRLSPGKITVITMTNVL